MNERFEILYKLDDNLYKQGSPIIVSAATLLKDTETESIIAQFKFQSVSEFSIKALKISINTYDISGEELTKIEEYQYLDLNVRNGEYFGSRKAIVIPDKVTRSIRIDKVLVVYENGDSYRISGEELLPLEKPKRLSSVLDDADLIQQYQLDVLNKGVYLPENILNLWYCICGKLNNTDACTACGTHKETLFNAYNLNTLRDNLNIRLEAERIERVKQQEKHKEDIYVEAIGLMSSDQLLEVEEAIRKFETIIDWKDSQEKIAQCKAKIEKLEIEATRIAKRRRTIGIITTIAIISGIILVVMLDKIIIPNGKYRQAIDMMEKGQYEQVINIFNEIEGYKDSDKLLIEAKYEYAIECLDEKNFQKSFDLLTEVTNYKDASEILQKFEFVLIKEIKGKSSVEYSYNEKGKLLKEIAISSGGDKDVTEYTYGDNGKKQKVVSTDSDGKCNVIEYTYDVNGHCLTRRQTTSSGYVDVREYSYDTNGKRVKEVWKGDFELVCTYSYDQYGNCIKEETNYESGTYTVEEYSYDSQGNLLRKSSFNSKNDVPFIREYTYDAKGNCLTMKDPIDGSIVRYTYDEQGNLLTEVDATGKVEYSYDDYGNCIKSSCTNGYTEEYVYMPIYKE